MVGACHVVGHLLRKTQWRRQTGQGWAENLAAPEGQGSALDPLGPEACWTGDKVDKLDRRHG
jgi:hypothetical protein